MSASSEQEFSDGTVGSPGSQLESPYSSPSQQVPHLASAFSGITCGDDVSMLSPGKKPYLRIVEQPQNYFRFRYKSEMVGTHGCVLGKTSNNTKATKTHPTVELVNYTGKALIRCRLSQADKDEEHPHKLLEDDQEDRDVSTTVPEQGSYKVGFAGMGIIHTAKKDVPALLFKKNLGKVKNSKQLRAQCENEAKNINLNIVRLRFSAHDIMTDKDICLPVFSERIHNMKSASTNDLKICRMSRCFGKPRGGDDVFILVEKVNKKNISIRFYELNENGDEVWSAMGNFLQSDVHHQYAIVFRTPPYKDPHITKNVKVFVELVRPEDGRTSEPKKFVYTPNEAFKQSKKRRINSAFSSLDSSSGGSIKSKVEVPATVEMINQHNDREDELQNIPVYSIHIPQVPMSQPSTTNDLVAEALFFDAAPESSSGQQPQVVSPMLGQPNIPEPPVLQLNSSEIERLINHDTNIPYEEKKMFCEMDWSEYMQSFGDSMTDNKTGSMDFIRSSIQLVADSGRGPAIVKIERVSPSRCTSPWEESRNSNIADKAKVKEEYNAFYKAEDGLEVKKLVKEICEIIKNKTGYKKQVVRTKLERLFEMRLSNGDTFLHMTLSSNQPSFEFIIKLIHSMKMPHLLNLTNDLGQSILHLAVVHDLPRLVALLVARGCDPMLGDNEGNNAVHYAVICQSCLAPLLEATKTNNVACDLNAYNHEKQTALHLAALHGAEASARLLLRHGAGAGARDRDGRAPLHLAAYDDCLAVTRALLDFERPSEIDAVDGRGNTALQIVCGGGVRENTVEIVKLLLDKKADPLVHEDHNEPAYKLASEHPSLRALMLHHVPHAAVHQDDIKSEQEDEFESADEGEGAEGDSDAGLRSLALYEREVAALLDASGAWRTLAERLHADALLSWYAASASPTAALLTHLQESGDPLTSKSLAMYLQDIGQVSAASVIRRYINE